MDWMFWAIFAAFACFRCVHSAQWSASFPDGAIVDACAGDVTVTFPWTLTLGGGEEIVTVEWFYHNSSDEMIGTFTHGNFLSMPSYSLRVLQVNTTGLVLSQVMHGDTGNYSVEVMVRDSTSGATSTLRHSAVLMVRSHSEATTDATVEVSQEPAVVYDNSTGSFHVHLTCTGHGRQPPAVIWTLPSGASKLVSTSEGGKFSLLVPNPVSGGNYTCSVHPSTPAARCLPTNSPVLHGDTIYVDRMEARLALLEAKDQDLQSKYDAVQAENTQLKNRFDQLLHDMANQRVAFHARFSATGTKLVDGARLVLNSVVYNQGNGYNSSTGVFTAPYSGTYTLLVTTAPSGPDVEANVYIRLNGTSDHYCSSPVSGDALACDFVAHLNAGQTVWVESWSNNDFYIHGTAFSGFLISPDQ